MAYDEAVADRVRAVIKRRKGVTEKKMFGGLAFMLNGNMCCGVLNQDLVLRLGEQGAAKALQKRHVREMDFTGRPMKTMVYVSPPGFRTHEALRNWVGQAAAFVETLEAK